MLDSIYLSYEEYLFDAGKKDCRRSWIEWKMDEYRMSEKEAIKAVDDPEWGWQPLMSK